MAGSHAALDAACVVTFIERWIPGSRSACPRMTFSIFTVALVTRHSSLVTRHSSLVTRHSSLVTRHSSLVTRHSSLVTRHSSLVTRHSSLVTRHSAHQRCS
ncbi:hypothetical protein [Prosthecochloris marina]|uniref:hypothetical protein n=1 Tax=Prosthecochloris marina TaxID=2017681 RepID=UPI0011B224FA|nr:hypothetical protein [Prosthecochloris marina]